MLYILLLGIISAILIGFLICYLLKPKKFRIPHIPKPNNLPSKQNYDFVTTYAPLVWLHSQEPFFPVDVEYHLAHTQPEKIDGNIWAVTRQPMTSAQEIQPWFHNVPPNSQTGKGAPVYAFVFSDLDENDPQKALANPLDSKIFVIYYFLYSYNQGKNITLEGVNLGTYDNHVGDIEYIAIWFDKGKPTHINRSYHQWDEKVEWNDPKVKKSGTHPIIYSAKGSHAMYWDAGTITYIHKTKTIRVGPISKEITILDLSDETNNGVAWNTWLNIDTIMPWDWYEKPVKDSVWNSEINSWITDVYRWGNNIMGHCSTDIPMIPDPADGVCELNHGPITFLLHSMAKKWAAHQ